MSVELVRSHLEEAIGDKHITMAELSQILNQEDPFWGDERVPSMRSFVDKDEYAVVRGLQTSILRGEYTCDDGVAAQIDAFVERGPDEAMSFNYFGKAVATSTVGGLLVGGSAGAVFLLWGAPEIALACVVIGAGVGLVSAGFYMALDD